MEGVKKECELPTCNMRMVGLQYANGLFTYRIVFFRVFKYVVFVRNLYGSCLMPMRANKKIPAPLVWAREAGVFICSVSRR